MEVNDLVRFCDFDPDLAIWKFSSGSIENNMHPHTVRYLICTGTPSIPRLAYCNLDRLAL